MDSRIYRNKSVVFFLSFISNAPPFAGSKEAKSASQAHSKSPKHSFSMDIKTWRRHDDDENIQQMQPFLDGESANTTADSSNLENGNAGEKRPQSPWGGEYAKSIVYAGLDAIVTCFSLVSAISGVKLSSVNVLVLGFSNLVADGISMGFGDFLSTTTERDMAASERLVADWDVRNNLHSQTMENLVSTYESLGMAPQDALMVVEIFSKYKDIMVDQKMVAEKGILPPNEGESPWKNGIVTFIAFLVFGCTPLLSYIILIPFTENEYIKFGGACALATLALVLLGVAKAEISRQNYGTSVLMAVCNGGIAAGAAYLIGWTLRNVAGLEE